MIYFHVKIAILRTDFDLRFFLYNSCFFATTNSLKRVPYILFTHFCKKTICSDVKIGIELNKIQLTVSVWYRKELSFSNVQPLH